MATTGSELAFMCVGDIGFKAVTFFDVATMAARFNQIWLTEANAREGSAAGCAGGSGDPLPGLPALLARILLQWPDLLAPKQAETQRGSAGS
jgi:hypothetical protein